VSAQGGGRTRLGARLKSLPDLPTADEAGLKGFELGVWQGIFAPRGTPPAVVQKLSAALKSALKDPDPVKRFNDISTEPMPDDRATPEAAQRMLASEIDRWAPIIRAGGICGLASKGVTDSHSWAGGLISGMRRRQFITLIGGAAARVINSRMTW
jgi:Tripartite tricarboxylate transporter family receptor